MPDSETCVKFGKFGVRVMIEDKEIQHYSIHVDAAKKEVSCWIASEAGKAFKVVWFGFDHKCPSRGTLHLDGHRVYAKQLLKHGTVPLIYQNTVVSESSCVPFVFSPLVVTDDDAYLDASPSQSIGEIKFIIERTTEPKTVTAKNQTYVPLPHLQKVHERSKKALAHRVSYGMEIPKPPATSLISSTVVEKLVTFIFKYRPLEMLHANDIVPRNPEPLASQEALDTPPISETSSGKGKQRFKVEKEVESGSEDEDSMKEKALLAEVEKIRKRRHLKDSQRPNKKLKKEEKPLFIHGEVIDLT